MPIDSTIAAMPGNVRVAPNTAITASVIRMWNTTANTAIQPDHR